MSCGAAAVLLGFLATIFGGQASQQDPALVGLPTNPTTLQNQCTWLDHLALPISDILEAPTSSPLCIPTRDPLQCSWAEQLNFLDWNTTPAVAALPPQPQSQWLDQLASFDRSDTKQSMPGVILGHVTTFNVFTLVASTVAFWAILKLSRWVWLHQEKLAPYLLTITIFTTYEAALATAPIHLVYLCGAFLIPYIWSITSWAFGKALLLRDPVTHKDYQTVLDQVESLTKSLATVEIAKCTADRDHCKATTTSSTKITSLESQLSKEQFEVTRLTAESEEASGDMEKLMAKNRSLETTTEELTETITGLHKERDSAAQDHIDVLERHSLKVSELNASLASATEHAQDLANHTEVQTTQIEALNTRIAEMERDSHTSLRAQETVAAQLSDAADELSLEKESLASENNTIRAEKTDLQQQLATLAEEKVILGEDLNVRTSEVTELKDWLATEKEQTERHAEQAEAQAAEIAQLRNTLDSLREALAAVNARSLIERQPTPHLVPSPSNVQDQVTESDCNMVSGSNDKVNDAPRMESLLEIQMALPTDSLISPSGPYIGTTTMVEHATSTIDAEVGTRPLPEYQLTGTELKRSDLNAARPNTDLQKAPLDKALEENKSTVTVSAAPPLSPPVTPPGNPASLFPSPDTLVVGLDTETSFSNGMPSTASRDLVFLADVHRASPLQAPLALALDLVTAPTAESTISEPSHIGPTVMSNPRKPRSLVSRALGAIHTGEVVPTSSRTPATPTETPAANTRPHLWDVLPDRVYPPSSGSRAGDRSATQPKHRGPKLGSHFHWEKKSSRPS